MFEFLDSDQLGYERARHEIGRDTERFPKSGEGMSTRPIQTRDHAYGGILEGGYYLLKVAIRDTNVAVIDQPDGMARVFREVCQHSHFSVGQRRRARDQTYRNGWECLLQATYFYGRRIALVRDAEEQLELRVLLR